MSEYNTEIMLGVPKSASLKDIVMYEHKKISHCMYNATLDAGQLLKENSKRAMKTQYTVLQDMGNAIRETGAEVKEQTQHAAKTVYSKFQSALDAITLSTVLEHSPNFYLLNKPKSASLQDMVAHEFESINDTVIHTANRLNDWIQDISEEKYFALLDKLNKTKVGKSFANGLDWGVSSIVGATEVNTSFLTALATSILGNYFATNYFATTTSDVPVIFRDSYLVETVINTGLFVGTFLYTERKKNVGVGRSLINLAEVGAIMIPLARYGYYDLRNSMALEMKNAQDISYGAATSLAQIKLFVPYIGACKVVLSGTEYYRELFEYTFEKPLAKLEAGVDMTADGLTMGLANVAKGLGIITHGVKYGVRKTNRGLRFMSTAAVRKMRRSVNNTKKNPFEE